MKKLTVILLFISCSIFAQIDSMKVNTLYIDGENRANITLDSINLYNGYPRQNTTNYCVYEYDSVLLKYAIILDKPTEKYLADAILNVIDLPTLRLPVDNLTTDAKNKLEEEIINNNWNTYIKNDNIWLFNFNQSADDTFTQNQRDYIISIGGEFFNFN